MLMVKEEGRDGGDIDNVRLAFGSIALHGV
jgi:hypothetical protein